jgi:hypothetical protein
MAFFIQNIEGLLGNRRNLLDNDFFFGVEISNVVASGKVDDMNHKENDPNKASLDECSWYPVDHLLVVEKDVLEIVISALIFDNLLDPKTIVGRIDDRIDNTAKCRK